MQVRDDMDANISSNSMVQDWGMPARKRARANSDHEGLIDNQPAVKHTKYRNSVEDNHEHAKDSSMTKSDPRTVGTFMAKHIPSQYAPQGKTPTSTDPTATATESNTKFCYRHRPDMLCRRQADEPSMDKMQRNLDKLSENDRKGIVQVWSLFSAAPSKHRNLMLQGILTQCCFPQLSFLSANVQKLIKIDFLAALPPEISFRILSSLDTISLCKAAQVSRTWRTLADDDVVWHRMCEQHIDRKCTKCGWGLPLLDRKRLRASKRQMQLRAAGQTSAVPRVGDTIAEEADSALPPAAPKSPVIPQSTSITEPEPPAQPKPDDSDGDRKTRPWKEVYRDRFRVGKNWKHGICSTKVLKGHTNGIMALHIHDNYLATGSYDATIKIWNLDTGEEVKTLRGHTMGIRCLQMDDTKLISGSIDRTVKVWDWRSGVCKATFTGHSADVIGLQFDSHILISGSADGTAIVRDMKNRSVSTLRGHTNWVNSIRIDGPSRTVFTGSDDFTVKLWDLDTKQCIRTFEGHVGHVQQVVLLPREFDAEEEATVIGDHMSDPGSPESLHTAASSSYSGHEQSPVLAHRNLSYARSSYDAYQATFQDGRPEPPQYMLTSALDNTIRMWDVYTGRCIRTFFGHVEGVWALAADSLRIVSGAQDRMLKVWDPRTGKCERTFTGHTGPVTCIGLSDSRMCSASEDGEVRVYCFSDPS
ncbi:hypothetical protein ES702_03423 [subsurface metagenome]